MVVHSASRFMQRIGKKRTRLQFQYTNYVCFDAHRAKYVHTTIHDFEIWFRGLSYGPLPSVDVDKHHDGCPSK